MHTRHLALLLATLLAASCSRTEAPQPAKPPPAAAVDLRALGAHPWRVTASETVAPGSLYVFLPEGILLVGTPGSPMARGSWRGEGGRLVMVEESRPYPVDVLELQARQLRLRSQNPGAPVEMTLAPVDSAAQPVPEAFRGQWAADQKACGQAGAESRLELAADRVRFHESSGEVLAATHGARDPKQLDLVLRSSGEGSTRLAWRRLRLAPDGTTLTDVTESAKGGLVRVRCR